MTVRFRRAIAADVGPIVDLLYDDVLGRTREIVADPVDEAYTSAFAAIDRDPNQLLAVAVIDGDASSAGEAPPPPPSIASAQGWALRDALERHGQPGVIGCLQLTFIPGLSHRGAWRGQIESVRVASTFRGHGIGRAFISWAVDQCRLHGCRMVQLTSSSSRDEARAFYQSLGFEATHVGFKLNL